MSLTLTPGASDFREPRAVLYALGTGAFIAGYTVTDGLGARLADSPHSYIFWLNIVDGIPIVLLAVYLRRNRFVAQARTTWKIGALAGVVSLLSYWIVTWAMTLAPLAQVSVVRETSMVFAALFGIVFLNERFNLARLKTHLCRLASPNFWKLNDRFWKERKVAPFESPELVLKRHDSV